MENEEDEERRRERILAEENGQDLGAALGIVLGLASALLEEPGPLPACKVGRENRVAKVELVNFLRERDKRGTNPKCDQTDNS